MPALLGRADIVVGRSSGLERLRALLRSSPAPVRRYLDPELPDPTRVLPVRPEPTPPGPAEDQRALQAHQDSPATTPKALVERRGTR